MFKNNLNYFFFKNITILIYCIKIKNNLTSILSKINNIKLLV